MIRLGPVVLVGTLLVMPFTVLGQDKPDHPGPQPHGPMHPGADAEAGRRHHPHTDPLLRPLSPKDLDQAIEILARIHPEMVKDLQRRRETDARGVARAIQRRFPRIRSLLEMQRYDPAMFELRIEDLSLGRASRSVARKLHAVLKGKGQDEAEPLRDEVVEIVTRHFEVRQQIREHELTRLERRIGELREQLAVRAESRQELIDQRLGELAGESAEPQW